MFHPHSDETIHAFAFLEKALVNPETPTLRHKKRQCVATFAHLLRWQECDFDKVASNNIINLPEVNNVLIYNFDIKHIEHCSVCLYIRKNDTLHICIDS